MAVEKENKTKQTELHMKGDKTLTRERIFIERKGKPQGGCG